MGFIFVAFIFLALLIEIIKKSTNIIFEIIRKRKKAKKKRLIKE